MVIGATSLSMVFLAATRTVNSINLNFKETHPKLRLLEEKRPVPSNGSK